MTTTALPDQRSELPPLQNLRHQRPGAKYYLGYARGRRRVENQVGNVREWLFTPKVRCADLAELNAHLAARGLQLARERHHPEQTSRKIIEVWEEERAALRAMPVPFDGHAEDTGRISQTCLVNFERNRERRPTSRRNWKYSRHLRKLTVREAAIGDECVMTATAFLLAARVYRACDGVRRVNVFGR